MKPSLVVALDWIERRRLSPFPKAPICFMLKFLQIHIFFFIAKEDKTISFQFRCGTKHIEKCGTVVIVSSALLNLRIATEKKLKKSLLGDRKNLQGVIRTLRLEQVLVLIISANSTFRKY